MKCLVWLRALFGWQLRHIENTEKHREYCYWIYVNLPYIVSFSLLKMILRALSTDASELDQQCTPPALDNLNPHPFRTSEPLQVLHWKFSLVCSSHSTWPEWRRDVVLAHRQLVTWCEQQFEDLKHLEKKHLETSWNTLFVNVCDILWPRLKAVWRCFPFHFCSNFFSQHVWSWN